ncbi:hypothetical protein GXP67_25165 [Rhodocytophaga rosea]|uniref:DUF6438 domain-containing protein n=1 Tax=Rhodocytophaga rosea TaxID=2704465 RepID=A0A6C0GQB2_9BACT|nr:DUF6438 domain-containing protein [Rhodocytophaga rosea]QHT69700.1 hypothetical protein GXP67_25165 [Rhodocytophaga rosea]
MRYLILILLIALLNCSQKQASAVNPELLINKFWIHSLTIDSNSIVPMYNQLIWKFDSTFLDEYDFLSSSSEYSLKEDTLTVFKNNEDQKNSLPKQIYFKAKIQKLTPDSLQLLYLSDDSLSDHFSFKRNQLITFFHEQLNYDSSLVINRITFSTRECIWGTCPVLKLELLSVKRLLFEGIENTRQFKGIFQGRVADSIYSKIENHLKLANIATMDTLLPGIIDGQRFELILHFNNNQYKKITGTIDHFCLGCDDVQDIAGYRRLQSAVYLLDRLYLDVPLKKLEELK